MLIKSINKTFIFIVFVFGIISFSVINVIAAPSVIGISGLFIHGQSVTISGSGFGTKSPAAPLVWNNHESCTSGVDIVVGCGYDDEDSDGSKAYIQTDRSYGQGTKSARMNYATGRDSMFPRIGNNIPGGALEVYATYQTYYTRYAGPGDSTFIFKWSRGGANPPYSGSPRFYETIRPGVDLNLRSFDAGFNTSTGTTWAQNDADYSLGQSGNKWNRVEYHYKLSNPAGTANGAFEQWVNSTKNINLVDRVTRLSSESGKTIDYIMTPFDGSDSYGTENGYYFWMDDTYIDITLSRVEICSGSTWTTRGKCDIQLPTTWDANGQKIVITINQGAIPISSHRYLYVSDSSGNTNSNGYAIIFNSSTGGIPNSPVILGIGN